ncbi:MAG: hypothetical protein K9M96_19195 [Deltaproteobacteria bacterium]|nr:hypothetical protein [Deltaproteobacteria bacterium]
MDALSDLLDSLFLALYHSLIGPALDGIAFLLNFLATPISGFSPRTQIILVAMAGAVISRMLARTFNRKRERMLNARFKEKLGNLKYTDDVTDPRLKSALKKGVHQSADEEFEKIMLDRFFEMGVTYFLPLFFFLIWLHYDRFSPEKLALLTGSPYAWVTDSGLKLSAAYVYLYFFNISLILLWLAKMLLEFLLKKRKQGDS